MIGQYGDIIFECSIDKFHTITDYKRESSGKWIEHELLGRKAISVFTGIGLEKISFKMILNAGLGVDIESTVQALREMRDEGQVAPLIIGGNPISDNPFRCDSISEANGFYNGKGEAIHLEIEVQLTEYMVEEAEPDEVDEGWQDEAGDWYEDDYDSYEQENEY